MTTLTASLNAEFTPAVGDFNVQITGVPAVLLRKNDAGAAFAPLTAPVAGAFICSNPIAGAVYKFQSTGVAFVQADQ